MSVVKRILGVLLVIVSIVSLVLSIAGIVGVWSLRTRWQTRSIRD